MAWKDWGNTLEIQRTLYIQFISSCLEYVSSSWPPLDIQHQPPEARKSPERSTTYNLKNHQEYPVDFLRLEANLKPLKDRYKRQVQKTGTLDCQPRIPESTWWRTMYHPDSRPDIAREQIQHASTMTSTLAQQRLPLNHGDTSPTSK